VLEESKNESLVVNNISDEEKDFKRVSTVSLPETPSPKKFLTKKNSVSALSQVSLLKESLITS
jgi:hypothetical protein